MRRRIQHCHVLLDVLLNLTKRSESLGIVTTVWQSRQCERPCVWRNHAKRVPAAGEPRLAQLCLLDDDESTSLLPEVVADGKSSLASADDNDVSPLIRLGQARPLFALAESPLRTVQQWRHCAEAAAGWW